MEEWTDRGIWRGVGWEEERLERVKAQKVGSEDWKGGSVLGWLGEGAKK